MKTKDISLLGILLALSIILGYLEFLFIPSFSIPGVKLGLSNLTVLLALYLLDKKKTILLGITKVIFSAFLFSGFNGLIYSFSGIVLSLVVMIIFHSVNKFSCIGISIAGAVFHNIGQLLAAMVVVESFALLHYGALLLVMGVVCGIAVGITAKIALKILSKSFYINNY